METFRSPVVIIHARFQIAQDKCNTGLKDLIWYAPDTFVCAILTDVPTSMLVYLHHLGRQGRQAGKRGEEIDRNRDQLPMLTPRVCPLYHQPILISSLLT